MVLIDHERFVCAANSTTSPIRSRSWAYVRSGRITWAPNGLTRIGGWTRLRTLSYNCNGTGTLDLSSLATCKRLTHFTLYHGDLMQTEHFRQLATAKSLEILSLCGCSFDGDDLIFLQNHPNLTTFSLTNCSPEPYIDLLSLIHISEPTRPY